MRTETNRAERVGYQLKRYIAELIQQELKDPRLGFVTITDCVMSKDLKHAKIYFSVIGDEKKIESTRAGLLSAQGFMKRRIADSLELRSIPDIVFYYDNSLDYGLAIDNLLKKVNDEK